MKDYSIKSIVDFVKGYEKEGMDKETALLAAVTLARGLWKKEHPDTSKMPEHLTPGKVMSSFKEEYEGRGEIG